MESITSSLVASEIAKKLRSDAVISSVSGKNSVSMLPDAGDKLVVKFAEQNYTLTMLSNGRDAVPATATFTVSSADEVASAGNRIHLVLSAGLETNIDLDFTSIFDDEILFLIKELSETCVLILSNACLLYTSDAADERS